MSYTKASSFTADSLSRQPFGLPMMLCAPVPRLIKRLHEAGYRALSLNEKLSYALIKYPPDKRASRVLSELDGIIAVGGPSILLKDYEMLFDPRYRLDVLKVICDLSKRVRNAALWPGQCAEGFLEYAQIGYPDHQRYEIEKYTVLCIK